jgi:4-amino-4-deoxy-L-arabinose transferase-like glycosyltransferase
MHNFRNHISRHTDAYILGTIVFAFVVLQIVFNTQSVVWWDEAIYIGMGKYIATGGHIGMWETFRPPLLPLLYAALYVLHIPLYIAGKAVVMLASVGSICLAYMISESIRKGSGLYSAVFLAVTPVFFFYAKLATTDILSLFFVLLAVCSYNKNRYFLAGIVTALAFLLRFPQGLIVACLALVAGFDTYDHSLKIWLKDWIARGLAISGGFLLLVVPYLVMNYVMYHDALLPMILANNVIKGHLDLYDLGFFYYARELARVAPFLYLSSLLLVYTLLKKKVHEGDMARKNLRSVVIVALVVAFYFFWQVHKELRYSLAFIPYVAILAGVGSYSFFRPLKMDTVLMGIFVVIVALSAHKAGYLTLYHGTSPYEPLYAHLEGLQGSVFSTNPTPVVFADVKISSIFETKKDFEDVFNSNSSKINTVFMNSCDIFCAGTSDRSMCTADVAQIDKSIREKSFREAYKETIAQCTYQIYQK